MGVSLDIAKRLRGLYSPATSNEDHDAAPEHLPLHLRVASPHHPETPADLIPAGFADD